jgi:hypothetical protein
MKILWKESLRYTYWVRDLMVGEYKLGHSGIMCTSCGPCRVETRGIRFCSHLTMMSLLMQVQAKKKTNLNYYA